MKKLAWKDHYSVGNDSIDFEHQELIGLINSVYTSLEGTRDIVEVEQRISQVHSEISAHFALEERLMREAGYAELEDHKNHHEELLDQLRNMMDAIENEGASALDELSEKLDAWFELHFSTYDARLHLS